MGLGHGKVILLGEHSVVYGRPALGAALSIGCRASASPDTTDNLGVDMAADSFAAKAGRRLRVAGVEQERRPFRVSVDQPEPDPEQEKTRLAFRALLESYPGPRPRLAVKVLIEVPSGAGLGCSAACAVAVVRALDEACGIARDASAVAEASMPWERVFHGNPSGIDSAMAATGAVALFRKGESLQKVKVAASPLMVIGHSGEASSTIDAVRSVARFRDANLEKTEAMFDEIAGLAGQGASALETGALDRLGGAMNRNQELLATLGVSTPRLNSMCDNARKAGALGAKLTGSGGGGCMIALASDANIARRVVDALQALGRQAIMVQIGNREKQ